MTVFLLKDDSNMIVVVLHVELRFQRLEFDFQLSVAVATAPKWRLPPASLWKPSEPDGSPLLYLKTASA